MALSWPIDIANPCECESSIQTSHLYYVSTGASHFSRKPPYYFYSKFLGTQKKDLWNESKMHINFMRFSPVIFQNLVLDFELLLISIFFCNWVKRQLKNVGRNTCKPQKHMCSYNSTQWTQITCLNRRAH